MTESLTTEQIADLCLKKTAGDERRAYALAEGLLGTAVRENRHDEMLGFSACLGWMEAKGWNLKDSQPIKRVV